MNNPAAKAIAIFAGIKPKIRYPVFSASKNTIVDAIAGACSNFVTVKIKLAKNTIKPKTVGAKITVGTNVNDCMMSGANPASKNAIA